MTVVGEEIRATREEFWASPAGAVQPNRVPVKNGVLINKTAIMHPVAGEEIRDSNLLGPIIDTFATSFNAWRGQYKHAIPTH